MKIHKRKNHKRKNQRKIQKTNKRMLRYTQGKKKVKILGRKRPEDLKVQENGENSKRLCYKEEKVEMRNGWWE